mmetsp:Transcript_55375/g.92137  ORF Transcript_55375/g.92137 Transcript_55375/m.92137 type:complete len:83 (-) Transcript_55375:205-453(-)
MSINKVPCQRRKAKQRGAHIDVDQDLQNRDSNHFWHGARALSPNPLRANVMGRILISMLEIAFTDMNHNMRVLRTKGAVREP